MKETTNDNIKRNEPTATAYDGRTKPPRSHQPGRKRQQLGVQAGYIFLPIYATTNRGKPIWQVPRGKDATGRRHPPATFHSFEQAQSFAEGLARGRLNDQMVFGRISAEGLKASSLVASLLEPFCARLGIGLEAAVKEYIAAKAITKTQVLPEVVKEHLSQPWITRSRTPMRDAIRTFLKAKTEKGCRDETIEILQSTLNGVADAVGNPAIGDVTSDQLWDTIYSHRRKSRSNKTVDCNLRTFYAWLKPNGYLRPDAPTAMDAVESPIVKHTPAEIMDVPTAKRALQIAVRDTDPELALILAIAMFTGIRSREIPRVKMEHVSPGERFFLPAEVAKMRRPRNVPIQPVLDAWMKPFYGRQGLLSSRHRPLAKPSAMLKKAGITWKHDWLRHSYCSYRLAATIDPLETAEEAGHSVEMLVRTYLRLVSKMEAEAYFALTPEACGIHDWNERVADFIAKHGECHQRATRTRKKKQ